METRTGDYSAESSIRTHGSSPVSVVHVVSRYPPGLGGVEKVTQYLARNQHRSGMRVSVLTSDQGHGDLRQEDEPFRVWRLKSVNILHTPVMPALLPRLFRLERSSIIHLHVPRAYTAELVWMYARLTRRPYLAHFHGVPCPSGRGYLLRVYNPLVLGRILRSAEYVVVFTDEQRAIVATEFGVDPARIAVIPNGIDGAFLYAGERALHSKPRLLFVGRLSVQKNIPLLLRALDGVSEKFDTTLVGTGELEGELRKAVEDLKLKNVRFNGLADGEELRDLYRNADVFVLPSQVEGMPLVLLEALAMALPIVATDVPGNRDLVIQGRNGVLVPPDSPSALREALVSVTSNPERYRQMSEASRTLAARYTWDTIGVQFERLYAQISRRRPGRENV